MPKFNLIHNKHPRRLLRNRTADPMKINSPTKCTPLRSRWGPLICALALLASAPAGSQTGVPLNALATQAPQSYTVKPGDTLWDISATFLKTPWQWAALWGMNQKEISNPHLIYPGQTLRLTQADGHARLQVQAPGAGAPEPAVRLSPGIRAKNLPAVALPTLNSRLIEPFLAEPMVFDEQGLKHAPRIVATGDGRVLVTQGDRVYARGSVEQPLTEDAGGHKKFLRIFRDVTPLKDPINGEILGYEAAFLGRAVLVRGESAQAAPDLTPATLDIISAREEMRVGDRLLAPTPQTFLSYVPHAPSAPVDARIMSIYGSAVVSAGQNQVVALNRGTRDGVERGHVLAILKDGRRLVDKTDAQKAWLKLPNERNGLLMVFSTFEKISYGLVMEITEGVKVGDRLVNPQ